LLRENTQVFIFKSLKKRDLSLILKEFTQIDQTVAELYAMYESCKPRLVDNFFMVDLSSSYSAPEYMFRHNFSPIDG